MFKEYQSKPITRLAMQITLEHNLKYSPSTSEASVKTPDGELVFKCYEKPQLGDYVCYLNDEDIYHCSRKVFHERNIVE